MDSEAYIKHHPQLKLHQFQIRWSWFATGNMLKLSMLESIN